ncbi:hypothetical protein JSQ81_02945 [Sporosarcina sp. Marseille-Q4063]|uniref:hypothetical protein n=1 Tax=Sporosarcina sp. Marseille-Q4063 TaxID=2810514 RepID=UPI001BAEB221|nr:hypothetical protein [Sporosarcina sp. Marseille-Q4063]QUW22560.1 hypothetical protein JSQ81_02945 [Sporosarcina sp. Marseille-Q4063]
MTEWISVVINILLLTIAVGTAVYASRALLMEYSSQVIVSRIRTSINIYEYYPFSWEAELKNVGKGYVVKAFILLSIPSRKSKWKKQYFLSKPIVGLKPSEHRIMRLTLKEEHIEKTNQDSRKEKVEILYQDAMNNIYIVSPGMLVAGKTNQHLQSFDKLPSKMSKFWIRYWIYKRKISKAIKQENSFPERLDFEIKTKQAEYQKLFKDVKFEPKNYKDAKS